MIVQEKEYMKLDVGKMVDNMLEGVVSPLTLWKVVMIIPVLFMVLKLEHVLIRIRPIWHT